MRAPSGLRPFIASVLLATLAYASAFLPGGPPAWAPYCLALGTVGSMFSAMLLGASRAGRVSRALTITLGLGFVLIVAGFFLALALPAEGPGGPLWLGLPRRAAILVYGIGLFPVLLLPLAYAFTFDRVTLTPEDLAEFRERLEAIRSERSAAADR